MSRIRNLRHADLPHLLELTRLAGWNQTGSDWERALALSPHHCFGIEADGRVVSTAAAFLYGVELAWIGMVLTHPDYRGKGNAKALLEHTLKSLRNAGIGWVKLDATEQGRPLYASMGFADECPVERWKRTAGSGPKPPAPPLVHPYVVDPSFDRAYFGAYRVPLLNALVRGGEAAYVVGYGYAMARPGALATYFGPSVVRTREAARKLLEWFLANHPNEDIFWDLFPDNSDAVQLAIDYGFQPARHLMRMASPCRPGATPLARHNSSVFAIAGFEYG